MMYSAVMRFVKRQYEIRNELAHWIWGISEDFPDGLIIREPVSHQKMETMMFVHQDLRELKKAMVHREKSDKKTYVYRQADLDKHAKAMFRAWVLADRLQFLLADPPDNYHQARKHFLEEPEIVRDYEHLKQKAAKSADAAGA